MLAGKGGTKGSDFPKDKPGRRSEPQDKRGRRSERELACPPNTGQSYERGPNELKLSDRGWRKGRGNRKEPAASLCSLERVVRLAGLATQLALGW